jgi:Protein of unknown function (DUF3570)
VVATERNTAAARPASRMGAVLAAALALPGVMAHGESAPELSTVALKFLQYNDSQPGLKRVSVSAPSVYVQTPLSSKWVIEGSAVSDAVSGASPRYHTAVSGASRMEDERHAGDVKLTHYRDHASYALGLSTSAEHDYKSRAVSLDATFASEDNNRSWNIGLGFADDKVSSTNDSSLHAKRRTTDVMLGVTQAWSARDLVQWNLSTSSGRGHYSDPYKEPDVRPDTRKQWVSLLRWNHHFEGLGSTLRTSYRYYRDSFGIRAHTLGEEWVQPLGGRFTVTPAVRYYSQSAASFYFDPVYDSNVGAPYPPGYFTNPPRYASPDQRLSAFGALTLGVKFDVELPGRWLADLKLERYAQRGSWRLGGQGSPGLAAFNANTVQVGLSKKF